jgi:hypothetical protein
MLYRWDSVVEDLNLFVSKVKEVVRKFAGKLRNKRGRPPKHDVEKYLMLIVVKEFDRKSLRGAEARLSGFVCGERVDHSVIGYWEKKSEVTREFVEAVREAGIRLEQHLPACFSVIDATKFSNWHKEEIEFHLFNRINGKTVYPVGISFLTGSLAAPVNEVISPGGGNLYADAGYDDNKSIGIMFKKGYKPIISPNSGRWKGYHRKKARKLYKQLKNRLGYRQRGRGESPFGSLTNQFGDRIKTFNTQATKTRTAARVLTYQIKILIRLTKNLLRILRHAPLFLNFINYK